MININKTILDIKREMLMIEAEALLALQKQGDGSEYILRSIIADPSIPTQNWGIAFIQHCVNMVDKKMNALLPELNHNSETILTDKVIRTWQKIDRRCRRLRPVPGDIMVMNYVKQGKSIESGQYALIMDVIPGEGIRMLEGGIVSSFDEMPVYSQKNEIRERIRSPKGTPKMRTIGCFSIWKD